MMRPAIYTALSLFVVSAFCQIVGIWSGDDRWGRTSAIFFGAMGVAVLIALGLYFKPERPGATRAREIIEHHSESSGSGSDS